MAKQPTPHKYRGQKQRGANRVFVELNGKRHYLYESHLTLICVRRLLGLRDRADGVMLFASTQGD